MLLPIFYMLAMSFRSASEIAAQPLGLPTSFDLENYSNAIGSMHYVRSVANSLGITIAVTFVVSLLGSMAAYPLARKSGRVGRVIILLTSLSLATPGFVTITPYYVILNNIGLLNTYAGIILVYIATNLPLAIFFYVGFISTIPRELEEAARLDNCGDWKVFWYVIRPLLGPATATLSLFVMLAVWNDFLFPLLLLTDDSKGTIMVSVYRFLGNFEIKPDKLFPAAVLASLPLLVLFVIFQRRIVSGMTSGAVK
ncbi:MAG: carbohydrate ABC transporter permease [Paracoccaceae bacterium]